MRESESARERDIWKTIERGIYREEEMVTIEVMRDRGGERERGRER